VTKILITGDRDWAYGSIIRARLQEYAKPLTPREVLVIHGGRCGAELLAAAMAFQLGMQVKAIPVKWKQHKELASEIRDEEMLSLAPDVVLHFPGKKSIAAWQMVRRANALGIPVRIFNPDGTERGVTAPQAQELVVEGGQW
jgi:hypothetical protein